MSRIVICRHGNTFDKGDIVTRVGSRTDLPLSTSGQVQAQDLKTYFDVKTSDYNFKKAYCSPLIRTQQTAQAILDSGHVASKPEVLDFLTEVDYGPDENKPEDAVIARIGQKALDAWDSKAIVPSGWQVSPHTIIKDWQNFLNMQPSNGGDILVVTSNGVARFVLQALTATDQITDIKLKTGAFGILVKTTDSINIELWNKRAK